MAIKRILGFIGVLVGFTLILAQPAQAAFFQAPAASSRSASISQSVNDDAFVAGNSVSVTGPVTGELFAAGNTVSVMKPGGRSIFAAGNSVDVTAGSAYDAFVAGNSVTLDGTYGHNVYAAGSTVVINPGTVIRGDLYIGGAAVVLHGRVNGDVHFATNDLTSDAVIDGSLLGTVSDSSSGGTITFTGGSIGGDFKYHANNDATGLNKVKIGGKTERQAVATTSKSFSRGGFSIQSWILSVLATLVLGAALILFSGKKVTDIADRLTVEWGRSLLVGVITLIIVPIVALIISLFIVGWQVALVAMAIYLSLLAVANVLAGIAAGGWLLRRAGQRKTNVWYSLLLGVIVLAILKAIPVAGLYLAIVIFVGLTLPAFGALLVWLKLRIDES